MATWNLEVDGVALEVTVERKRVKNVNARLRGSSLAISAPIRLSEVELQRMIEQLARRLVRRVRASQVNREESALELAQHVARRFPSSPVVRQVNFVTTQCRRWGSYSAATGSIRLNVALRQMPRWVLEAVVAHELAHVFHQNHSPAFWKLLQQVCPETQRARAFLFGVTWVAQRWEEMPGVDRALLTGPPVDGGDDED